MIRHPTTLYACSPTQCPSLVKPMRKLRRPRSWRSPSSAPHPGQAPSPRRRGPSPKRSWRARSRLSRPGHRVALRPWSVEPPVIVGPAAARCAPMKGSRAHCASRGRLSRPRRGARPVESRQGKARHERARGGPAGSCLSSVGHGGVLVARRVPLDRRRRLRHLERRLARHALEVLPVLSRSLVSAPSVVVKDKED